MPARRPRLSRFLSLLASLAIHSLAVFLFFSVPEALRKSETPPPEVAAVHESTPLIWYPPTRRLPEIAAHPTANQQPRPTRKTRAAPQTIVTEYKAPPGEQILWHPKPEVELHHDIESPNLVSLPPSPPPAPSLPTGETQPKPEHALQASRTFVPPAIHREIPAPVPNLALPAPPAVELALASPHAPALEEPKLPSPPAKRFVAPKSAIKTPATVADRGMVVDSPPIGRASPRSPGLEEPRLPGPPTKRFVAPKSANKTPATVAGRGMVVNSPPQLALSSPDANPAVIIGLRPSLRTPPPLPPAVREARISAGDKNNGEAEGGEATKSARAIVPGVNVGAGDMAAPPGLVRPKNSHPRHTLRSAEFGAKPRLGDDPIDGAGPAQGFFENHPPRARSALWRSHRLCRRSANARRFQFRRGLDPLV